MYQEERGARSIKALIYTHSHADYLGGTNAITEAKVASPDLEIYAPEGFLEHAMSENLYARNAMARRAVYIYMANRSQRVQRAKSVLAWEWQTLQTRAVSSRSQKRLAQQKRRY